MSSEDKTSFETMMEREWSGGWEKLEKREQTRDGLRRRLAKPVRVAIMSVIFSGATVAGVSIGLTEQTGAEQRLAEQQDPLDERFAIVRLAEQSYSDQQNVLDMNCRPAIQPYLPSGVLRGMPAEDVIDDLNMSGLCNDMTPGYLTDIRDRESKLIAQQEAMYMETVARDEYQEAVVNANDKPLVYGLLGALAGCAGSMAVWFYHKDPDNEYVPKYSNPTET